MQINAEKFCEIGRIRHIIAKIGLFPGAIRSFAYLAFRRSEPVTNIPADGFHVENAFCRSRKNLVKTIPVMERNLCLLRKIFAVVAAA